MAEAQTRTTKKSLFTREKNNCMRWLAEQDMDKVKTSQIKLSNLFDDFTEAHYIYVDSVEEDDAHNQYYVEVQNEYIELINKARDMRSPKEPEQNSEQKHEENTTMLAMLQMASLPRLEIESFNGDPLKYKEFMSIFEETVGASPGGARLKLSLLLKSTSGKAKEAISKYTLMDAEEGYEQAKLKLEERFGSPYLISTNLIADIKSGKPVRSSDELLKLSDKLENAELILNGLGMYSELDTQASILDVCKLLQPHLMYKWRDRAMKVKSTTKRYPNFSQFTSFIKEIATTASDPVYGQMSNAKPVQQSRSSQHVSGYSASVKSTPSKKPFSPCVVCQGEHRLFYCDTFKTLPVKDRIIVVEKNKLCENCLLDNHSVETCFKRSICSVPGCGKKHTKFLHITDINSNGNAVCNNSVDVKSSSVLMPIVPITVNGRYNTYALLDTGSNTSFCTSRLVNKLGISGSTVSYEMNTLHGSNSVKSQSVNLNVMSNDRSERLSMFNVLVIDSIPVDVPFIDVGKYPHLVDIPTYKDVVVDVLIGQDNAVALRPLDIRSGKNKEPFATRTLLGWCLNGPVTSGIPSRRVTSNFISTASLEREVEMLWHIDDEGVGCKNNAWSPSDEKVISLWNQKCKVVDGHIMLPIPWRNPEDSFPNNKMLAMSRLMSLKRSLEKKNTYSIYDTEVKLLLSNGYAELVPDPLELRTRIWYLPHHSVPKKNGKIRLVFDCASRYDGSSLNERCHQGPDLNNKLSSVLLRFREHPYAVSGDIEAMYNQVLIPPEDRDALRFLWFDGKNISHYRMRVHLFGGVWCSSAAIYAMKKTTELQDLDLFAYDAINNYFYVDDYLASFTSTKDAIKVSMSTKMSLNNFGFNLTKFMSPNREIMSHFNEQAHDSTTRSLTSNTDEKALGIRWDLESDTFYFTAPTVPTEILSKRIMLSFLSSIFDPLGLLSPIIITGKILFQKATRSKIGWDEPIEEQIQLSWNSWMKSLSFLDKVKIPRCIKPTEFDECAYELHAFGDASESAYGACVYLRCVNKHGAIHTALLFAKHRVCPIKTLTIPRLELQAAVLVAKISATLSNELTIQITKRYYWTDSSIVLCYIKNENRRFQTFIANRVSKIHQLSNADDWYHVSGKDNPADMISRGSTVDGLDQDLWFGGAAFLHSYKVTWPDPTFELPSHEDMELKRDPVKSNYNNVQGNHPIDCIIDHFSKWDKIKRITAWLIKIRSMLCHKVVKENYLTASDITVAERCIVKHIQQTHYADELVTIQHTGRAQKGSNVYKLSPSLDTDGILVVKGRMSYAPLHEGAKHPYILPYSHVVSSRIVRHYHEIAHSGCEWVLSLLRQQYWITNARSLIKKVSRACITCKKRYGKTSIQQMAPLPQDRVTPFKPVFAVTGVDCFGPFLVKYGRSEIKRYGCVFTCFSSRAIHIEMLYCLDTDSFINGFKRFMSRRGRPEKIYSDNGLNFVGANNELNNVQQMMDRQIVNRFCSKLSIEWHFNPPHASHMGGVWERMIRTVRRVLIGVLNPKTRLTDDVLSTVLAEVEAIVNSRPMTKVSDDVNDFSALSPSHLLAQGGFVSPKGVFTQADMYKKRWRYGQWLADQFWRRWLKQYLPELQKRSKWLKQHRNLSKGDLVLIEDENTPRCLWPMGLVLETHDGRDKLVRSARIKTRSTELVRPITKLVLLEGDIENVTMPIIDE